MLTMAAVLTTVCPGRRHGFLLSDGFSPLETLGARRIRGLQGPLPLDEDAFPARIRAYANGWFEGAVIAATEAAA